LTKPEAAKARGNSGFPALMKRPQTAASRSFAQILGKLYFVQLFENLRRILVDYGQKRPRRANVAFNAAC
jgi:hypothetical protein